ncbi:PREDICTED: uncharacterized protein LOC106806153 [Priapulus caudatus]|uniref:Uncharacterized protein LOC106806153 n=1 Tax=Priapulus caudatus TaxID=37621 RepID=A0ABM1DU81_PRICU|nr:PREDICTED: uncharacterized protein LOC106806153 [Priapulus caudatus]
MVGENNQGLRKLRELLGFLLDGNFPRDDTSLDSLLTALSAYGGVHLAGDDGITQFLASVQQNTAVRPALASFAVRLVGVICRTEEAFLLMRGRLSGFLRRV